MPKNKSKRNSLFILNGEVISSINEGLCAFIGISSTDTAQDIEYITNKILSLKVFDGADNKRWKCSVVDRQMEVLCVSQFTLYSVLKGNKPDFHNAMPGEDSKCFYENFLQTLKNKYLPDKIKDGQFGAYMQVSVQNDGPVTFLVESPACIDTTSSQRGIQRHSHT